ncbi:MAG: (d)CMP kinase [Dehalococcoidia bacterium]
MDSRRIRAMGKHLPGTIAIDGAAASGKSSLGKALAAELGYRFLDTGLMYRAFALAAMRAGLRATEPEACVELARELPMRLEVGEDARVWLDEEDVTPLLRSPEVEASVSPYSAIPGVRAEMVRRQQEFAGEGRAVLAGRDIGTVVLPDAPVKFFLRATEDVRALRRSSQAEEWGERQASEEALRDIAGRDRVDTRRKTSPLRPARDAIVIDTTDLTLEEVVAQALERVRCAG